MDSAHDAAASLLTNDNGRSKGLGVAMAAIFLAGQMAGSGTLALPFAISQTGTYEKHKTEFSQK